MAQDELELTGEPSPKKKPKKPVSSTMRAEAHFMTRWNETWPDVPLVDYREGRDRALLKHLIAKLGEEGTLAAIDRFFAVVHTDWEISRKPPTVPLLAATAQRLLLAPVRKNHHPRTLEHLNEARKAMGKDLDK